MTLLMANRERKLNGYSDKAVKENKNDNLLTARRQNASERVQAIRYLLENSNQIVTEIVIINLHFPASTEFKSVNAAL